MSSSNSRTAESTQARKRQRVEQDASEAKPKRIRARRKKCTNLLSLPQELRDEIYSYVVQTENPVASTWGGWDNVAVQPLITQVNRKLRRETLPMFYKQNIFRIELWEHGSKSSTRDALAWLTAIGDKNTKYIRRLNIEAPPMHDVDSTRFRIVKHKVFWDIHLVAGTMVRTGTFQPKRADDFATRLFCGEDGFCRAAVESGKGKPWQVETLQWLIRSLET